MDSLPPALLLQPICAEVPVSYKWQNPKRTNLSGSRFSGSPWGRVKDGAVGPPGLLCLHAHPQGNKANGSSRSDLRTPEQRGKKTLTLLAWPKYPKDRISRSDRRGRVHFSKKVCASHAASLPLQQVQAAYRWPSSYREVSSSPFILL